MLRHLFTSLLAIFLLWGGVRSVTAHADLIAAEPSPGAVLATSPPQIRLQFSESIRPESSLILLDAAFHQIPLTSSLDTSQMLLTAEVPVLAHGRYTVQWFIINVDNHLQSGSYEFRIGDESMLAEIALAESVAFNPPGWVGWLFVLLALGVPIAAYFWQKE